MRRALTHGALLAGAALALGSTVALAAPESLLPPSFRTPSPAPPPPPTPAPAPAPAPPPQAVPAPAPAPARPAPAPSPVIQPLPTGPSQPSSPTMVAPTPALPAGLSRLPSLRELERMDEDEFNQLFGLVPKYDIPPGARRAVRQVGVIGAGEGGLPVNSLASQPPALVLAALAGIRQPLVSRWGHILLRRTLASRLEAPRGMSPVAFATLRADLLNRIGEGAAARALVQDIDSANYTPALAGVAIDSYLATGDILGICPVAQLRGTLREDAEWDMVRAICRAHSGDPREAERQLDRALARDEAPEIDLRLAQRYAYAAGGARRAVNIEWDGVEELTPWRHGLARSLGMELPEAFDGAAARLGIGDVLNPAVPLTRRVERADRAAERGILSSAAMVDLYAQLWADQGVADEAKEPAGRLRAAYVASSAAGRLAAMRTLWNAQRSDGALYGRQVLTAYAAARLVPAEPLVEEAPALVASMLAAGLDRNAMRWAPLVPDGGLAWAQLALADPDNAGQVSGGALDSFVNDDGSEAKRKAQFLVAGLAGLGRLDMGTANSIAGRLDVALTRQSPWAERIDRAAELGNPTLVALLAAVGMQGEGWERMTARQLFHIVRALNQVGLGAEARMIAAEAVARA